MLSVIVPVFDEPGIYNTVKILRSILSSEDEIIVVDDGSKISPFSSPASFKFLQDSRAVLIRKHLNEGKGAALKSGFEKSRGDIVVFIDGDLQVKPEIDLFLKVMNSCNADSVIGNKRHPFSIVHYSFWRWLVSNSYNTLCRILFGIQLRDTQTGFKLFKREAIRKVMDKVMCKRFAFDIELILALRDNGFRVADAPVVVNKTIRGCASAGNISQTLIDTLAVFYRRSIGWYRLS